MQAYNEATTVFDQHIWYLGAEWDNYFSIKIDNTNKLILNQIYTPLCIQCKVIPRQLFSQYDTLKLQWELFSQSRYTAQAWH